MSADRPSEPRGTASAAALELPPALAVIAELAATDVGRRRLLALAPAGARDELETRRRRYTEASRLLEERRLVPALDTPVSELLDLVEAGAATGPSLLDLAALLTVSGEARDRLAEAEAEYPELAAAAAELEPLDDLVSSIRRSLDRRGAVREDATPELAGLRRAVRRQRESLYGEMQRLVERHRDLLSEETVPIRDGRLVLVVQAGALGRADGLVHGRSASGKSFYFEPLEAVGGNNRLQQASTDAEVEEERILGELVAEAHARAPAVSRHAELVAELDVLQAAHRFAVLTDARLPALAEPGSLCLRAARHPLLVPELAELRESALGQAGHREPVVPLDLELGGDRRVLVVTGPNAGGKTVALKTVGLLALLSQCGLPIPAAAGSCMPWLADLVAAVGDEQDLLADRSTFSGRLQRLSAACRRAGPETLVLLDELGSGTDPEEGAALGGAIVELLASRSTLAIVTTHSSRLAGEALELDGAACAAMATDDEGTPTFRLLAGPPGASGAIALARRLGLDPELLAAAERRLTSEGRDYRRLLAEVEAMREKLRGELGEAEIERRRLAEERRRSEGEREELVSERRSLAKRLDAELAAFRREVRKRLGDEVDRLVEELAAGRRRGLAAAATERLFADAPALDVPEEEAAAGPLVVGGWVRHRSLGLEGELTRLDGAEAEVSVRGKRLRVKAEDLVLSGADAIPDRGRATAVVSPDADDVDRELNLIGQRVEPALALLERHLDRALLVRLPEVRVVHGHGSGRLRKAVRRRLSGHRAVASFRPGEPREGGDGATVVALAIG